MCPNIPDLLFLIFFFFFFGKTHNRHCEAYVVLPPFSKFDTRCPCFLPCSVGKVVRFLGSDYWPLFNIFSLCKDVFLRGLHTRADCKKGPNLFAMPAYSFPFGNENLKLYSVYFPPVEDGVEISSI